MIKMLHKVGMRSTLMYTAGVASIGLAVAAWAASKQLEEAGLERADHWGIFIGEWAPTFFAMGVALRMEEMRDRAKAGVHGHRGESDSWVSAHAPASATM
ncbi:hypothetical protein GCM10022254_62770 [Actinomadura meridiana]|uniref:DUF2637 domain-containing protein n=1 Tax=Actinomadura meridiana TaxID=559626 RepID=A0ABP8CJ46_9ACTN